MKPRQEFTQVQTAAIVLAGGSGSRLGATENKVYLEIGGKPLVNRSLCTFAVARAQPIVLVIRPGDEEAARRALMSEGIDSGLVVLGGRTRHESEWAGLAAIQREIELGRVELVAIHDGARPFVTRDLFEELVRTAAEVGGAVPGLPVDAGLVQQEGGRLRPLASGSAVRVQTPQVFRARDVLDAYQRCRGTGFAAVDTAETVERFGRSEVAVVAGDPRNLKVTHPDDLKRAEEIANSWDAGRWTDER